MTHINTCHAFLKVEWELLPLCRTIWQVHFDCTSIWMPSFLLWVMWNTMKYIASLLHGLEEFWHQTFQTLSDPKATQLLKKYFWWIGEENGWLQTLRLETFATMIDPWNIPKPSKTIAQFYTSQHVIDCCNNLRPNILDWEWWRPYTILHPILAKAVDRGDMKRLCWGMLRDSLIHVGIDWNIHLMDPVLEKHLSLRNNNVWEDVSPSHTSAPSWAYTAQRHWSCGEALFKPPLAMIKGDDVPFCIPLHPSTIGKCSSHQQPNIA